MNWKNGRKLDQDKNVKLFYFEPITLEHLSEEEQQEQFALSLARSKLKQNQAR